MGYSVSLRGEDYVPCHEFGISFAYPGNPDDAPDWGSLVTLRPEDLKLIELITG